MREALEGMRRAAAEGEPAAYVAEHSAFHGAAYALAASPLREAIWARVEAPMRFLLRLRDPGISLEEAVQIHGELLSLLAEGDLDGALQEVTRHLRTEEAWLRGESVRDARARTA
jgi:DNA-binding GntR family transcriptional regulator